MKLQELRKLSKNICTILVGLFALGFSIIIAMVTGIILFQNALMNPLQFIVFQTFCMTLLGTVAIVFNLLKDINHDVQTRLTKTLKNIRRKRKKHTERYANAINQPACTTITANTGNTNPTLRVIGQNQPLRKQA